MKNWTSFKFIAVIVAGWLVLELIAFSIPTNRFIWLFCRVRGYDSKDLWFNRPNTSSLIRFGVIRYLVTIDEDGCRTYDSKLIKRMFGKKRHAFIVGDSVVYGYCLGYDATISAQLDKLTPLQWHAVASPGDSHFSPVGTFRMAMKAANYLQQAGIIKE